MMWQRLFFFLALLVAALLLALVFVTPWVIDSLPSENSLLQLFVEDTTVRRSSIAGAVGLIVTAYIFFRPGAPVLGRKHAPKKPPPDDPIEDD